VSDEEVRGRRAARGRPCRSQARAERRGTARYHRRARRGPVRFDRVDRIPDPQTWHVPGTCRVRQPRTQCQSARGSREYSAWSAAAADVGAHALDEGRDLVRLQIAEADAVVCGVLHDRGEGAGLRVRVGPITSTWSRELSCDETEQLDRRCVGCVEVVGTGGRLLGSARAQPAGNRLKNRIDRSSDGSPAVRSAWRHGQ
jgi:hypothetical protein